MRLSGVSIRWTPPCAVAAGRLVAAPVQMTQTV
jgi:hypothetical protein